MANSTQIEIPTSADDLKDPTSLSDNNLPTDEELQTYKVQKLQIIARSKRFMFIFFVILLFGVWIYLRSRNIPKQNQKVDASKQKKQEMPKLEPFTTEQALGLAGKMKEAGVFLYGRPKCPVVDMLLNRFGKEGSPARELLETNYVDCYKTPQMCEGLNRSPSLSTSPVNASHILVGAHFPFEHYEAFVGMVMNMKSKDKVGFEIIEEEEPVQDVFSSKNLEEEPKELPPVSRQDYDVLDKNIKENTKLLEGMRESIMESVGGLVQKLSDKIDEVQKDNAEKQQASESDIEYDEVLQTSKTILEGLEEN